MATLAEINAQLDSQGTGRSIRILKHAPKAVDATTDQFLCLGMSGAYVKKTRWINTTNTDTDAQQATAIQNGMV